MLRLYVTLLYHIILIMLRLCYGPYVMQNIIRKIICSFIPGKASFWKPGGIRQAEAEYREQFEDIIQEVSNYKVKMENILCKTDIKEQDLLFTDYR